MYMAHVTNKKKVPIMVRGRIFETTSRWIFSHRSSLPRNLAAKTNDVIKKPAVAMAEIATVGLLVKAACIAANGDSVPEEFEAVEAVELILSRVGLFVIPFRSERGDRLTGKCS